MPHPDEDNHPHATGLAAKTVAKHSDKNEFILYAGWFCPFVQKAWISLEEKKVPYQYVEVNPYQKPESLMKLNPRGLVPTLAHNNKALYESNVIIEYIEDAFPDHDALLPSDPYERGYARLWMDFINTRIVPTFFRYIQAQDGAKIQEFKQTYLNQLLELTKAKRAGLYFMGSQFTLVDVCLAPWLVRAYALRKFKGFEYPDTKEWDTFLAWNKELCNRKSVLETQSDDEHYGKIYARYAKDEAQSEVAKAMREGKALP